MKAVVMAGGHGTRLRPAFPEKINKHLLPVGSKVMIEWPLITLKQMGVTDVLVMLNGENPQLLMQVIERGELYGLNILYNYRYETSGGSVAKTLMGAHEYISDEPFILILGDSYFSEALTKPSHDGCHAWVMERDEEWDDMSKYPELPTNPDLLQTGVWQFGAGLFKALGDLMDEEVVRIRDLVNHLHSTGHAIRHTVVAPRTFIDCGTYEAIAKVTT